MLIIKPTWLAHAEEKRRFEVYTCHVSADGKRLATGGLDGTVRIWSTEAILKAGDQTYQGPRQLCSMNTHTGAVLAVRWSGTNRYLASGSDDKIVLIYERDPNAAPSRPQFGSSEPGHTETWRTYRRLAGHDNDVQDVGWSADSSILVSVGLDSKVVIWSGSTFERLKRLDVHQSHVKGLTFDPANKYFATASDDRSIKVFRFTPPAANTSMHDVGANFVTETTITKPFTKSPITTYFRRCSWSPDGAHIAAANATNGPVSSVAIINRGTWDSDINLIGHEGPVEVCSFAPRMFSREQWPPQNGIVPGQMPHLTTVIACAGQDKSLSLWNTSSPRPLVIAQNLATKTISDLAWSPDGRSLFATSLDGNVVAIIFEEGDLGYVVGLEENERLLQKFGTARKGVGIPESVDFLLLEEKGKQEERREVEGRMGALMMDGGGNTNGDTIMSGTAQNGVGAQWQMQIHGQDSNSQPAVPDPKPTVEPKPEKRAVQKITITKDGRKRVTPVLVSSATTSNLPNAQLLAKQITTGPGAGFGPQSTLDLSRPYDGLPKGGLAAVLLGNKRRNPTLEEAAENEDGVSSPPKRKVTAVNVSATAAAESTEVLRPPIINPALSASQVRLAVPKIRNIVVRALDSQGNPAPLPDNVNGPSGAESQTGEFVFEAKNNIKYPHPNEPTKLSVAHQGKTVWVDYLPKPVILITATTNFYAAACEDGTIHVFTPAGRRLLSPLVLDATSCFLESRGWWLMAITCVGACHVWNLQTMKSKYGGGGVSLAPIFDLASILSDADKPVSKAESITEASVNGNGNVIICLTSGDGFVYSSDLCVWQKISEAWWATGSQFWDTSGGTAMATGAGLSSGIIPFVERRTTAEVLMHGRGRFLQGIIKRLSTREGWEGFESTVSVAHLENRIAAAKSLQAKDDFKTYLTMYARRIAMEGAKHKVEELCKELMTDVNESMMMIDDSADPKGESKVEDTMICGWDKTELLKSCLLIFGKFRELQRITIPYARAVGMLIENNAEDL
ncbi:HIR complex subunit [Orbilia oligospora]|nr:HIR complex subunit [Orbilia oligospora]